MECSQDLCAIQELARENSVTRVPIAASLKLNALARQVATRAERA